MILDNSEDERVCKALGTVGIEAESIYDLVNSSSDYGEAIPLLLEWLPKVKSDRIKEGVARALTVSRAGAHALDCMIREFINYKAENKSQDGTKWAMGNAISVMGTRKEYQERLGVIIDMCLDPKHGTGRWMMLYILVRFRCPETIEAFYKLLDDPDLRVFVPWGLARLRVFEARDTITAMLDDPDPHVRDEAKKALAKLDKYAAKKQEKLKTAAGPAKQKK